VQEVVESKRQLDEVLGMPTDFFCYPYGDYDAQVVDVVKNAGFRGALSCIRGSAYPGREDPFQIPRKAISYGDSLVGFWWKLHMKNRKKTVLQSC
jgi:peptidoglycan/xylan/chitin deacetylase (PgdA/CDA1 family)